MVPPPALEVAPCGMPFGSRRPFLPATCLRAHHPDHSDVHESTSKRLRLHGSSASLPPGSPRTSTWLPPGRTWLPPRRTPAHSRAFSSSSSAGYVVDTETAYFSNVRAPPIPADTDNTFGIKGTLQYPPAILAHRIEADVTIRVPQ